MSLGLAWDGFGMSFCVDACAFAFGASVLTHVCLTCAGIVGNEERKSGDAERLE